MIQYLKRNQIDLHKYDACVLASTNSRIYAQSWYLDSVTFNWDVLVLNDYEAVMPLPWNQKYFIKYIYPPAWVQQLGVFSKEKLTQQTLHNFVNSIPKKFKKITIQFNAENKVSFLKSTQKQNYILNLNAKFTTITDRFTKNRKRDLNKAIESELFIDKNITPNQFFKFYLTEAKIYKLTPNQILYLKQLLNTENKSINIWGIHKNNKLIAGLVWLKDPKRITYLIPVATAAAKKIGLPTKLIVELIKEFSDSNFILDFEGSVLKGVANFYKSFGAEVENYSLFKKYNF